MRWRKETPEERVDRLGEWHKSFAWWPRQCKKFKRGEGWKYDCTVFFEPVYRRLSFNYYNEHTGTAYITPETWLTLSLEDK